MQHQRAGFQLIFAMSRDKKLPRVLSKVHPKYKTPYINNFFAASLSLMCARSSPASRPN
jgi:amino acid transporter